MDGIGFTGFDTYFAAYATYFAVFPLLMGLSISDISQNKRAIAMGVFQSTYAIGMALGPVVFGFMVSSLDIAMSYVILGALALCAVIYVMKAISSEQ